MSYQRVSTLVRRPWNYYLVLSLVWRQQIKVYHLLTKVLLNVTPSCGYTITFIGFSMKNCILHSALVSLINIVEASIKNYI